MENSQNQSKKSTVIFIHIPKAAGSTLNEILWREYGFRNKYKISNDEKRQASIDNLSQMPESKRLKIRLIHGHMPFGLHKYLTQPVHYLAMLRNPVDRIVSEYYYIRRTKIHSYHEELLSKDLSIEEFFRRYTLKNNSSNFQTRMLAGCIDLRAVAPPYADLPDNALELAKVNLTENIAVCGLSERFDESLFLMQKKFGWRHVYYRKKNVGKERLPNRSLPASVLRLIERENEEDIALHDFAKKRLEMLLENYGIDEKQIQRFRAVNKYLGQILWTVESFPQKRIAMLRGYA